MLGWKYDYGPFLLGPRVGAPPALTRGRAGKLFSPFPRIRTLTATFVNPVPAIGASVVQFRCTVTLRELCQGHVPEPVLRRMDENGFIQPTEVQQQGLPVLFTGSDCVLHAQTGSGKTLTYLLLVYSIINTQRSAVQALIVVPTRELGMQVTKVARMLAAKPSDFGSEQQKSCTVMALLDGGLLKRHKTWLKADPPTIVVATVASLCQMLEKHVLDLGSMRVLVVDEVDFMFNSSKQVSSLRKLLTSYSSSRSRQTVFASASIPQHRRFLHDCVQQKWTKSNVVHVHVNAVEPMPSRLHHRYMEVRKKSCYLIVATDLAARGVDLPETTHIYNFDLPKSAVHYLHRAGRAGRKPFSDAKCIITSIIAPEEHFVLQRFEHELKFNCEELFL
ncbi:DEAD-box ATP-dependent RNA helicase 58, chloroplastic-like isoform X6 [Chenopodium quinoa]|uniref:DEAD-box ATP-dependent RNA helicase 58, chloroplastic-like isoform X6 n=1 Tax=Chenopodium quinoa TaxID=63459 RepID=UPI000B79469B|nr:DEAD-box ATP-dependent RNA helicase 58, chloroplastic-like isoform X6 [Chenopodium quinoa]